MAKSCPDIQNVKKSNSKSGRGIKNWKFFAQMDNFLKDKAGINPSAENLFSSLSAEQEQLPRQLPSADSQRTAKSCSNAQCGVSFTFLCSAMIVSAQQICKR